MTDKQIPRAALTVVSVLHVAKLTVFLELRSRKTIHFSEQIRSADKYPSMFSLQKESIVYLLFNKL